MRRGLLIYNPSSGMRRHRRRLPAILEALRSGGIATEAVATDEKGQATKLARAATSSVDVVFGYGGDGTIREVAAGLFGSDTPLGVLPGGTTNVVAIAFGLSRDPVLAASQQCRLEPRPVDVGLCSGHPFLMQASSGVEAYLMARLDPDLKAWLGFAGAVMQGVGVFFRYRYPQIQLRVDGERTSATGAMVCNIPEAAGPYRVIPAGKFDDGQLELMLFRGRSRAAVASFCVDLYRGTHASRSDVEIRPVREVVFEGPPEAYVQIDGDAVLDPYPVLVRLADRRLMALVGPPPV
jgi:diacylglycerol kinase family enzyme